MLCESVAGSRANTHSDPDKPFDSAKFDVQHYKMIPYKNNGNGFDQLKQDIEKELKAFYSI